MATLAELAELIGATVQGDPALEVTALAPIDAATAGMLTFLSNPKYAAKLVESKASAVIVPPGVDLGGRSGLICANPYLAFARIQTYFHPPVADYQGILPGASVAESADIHPQTTVFPGAVIGRDVKIGRGTIIHPGVVLYDGVVVGEDCLLHANAVVREGCRLGCRVILQPAAVIGSDGFGYAPDGRRYVKIPQVGIVELEDDVEIGACACIDRAAMGVTRIRRGSKIDNLVQIAHNVEIGEDCILVSQVGIAGSTKIGNHCTFGGQSAAVGHLTVGDNLMLGARGALAGNTEGHQILSGAPAIPHRQWLKASQYFNRLPEMQKELVALRKRLDQLESSERTP